MNIFCIENFKTGQYANVFILQSFWSFSDSISSFCYKNEFYCSSSSPWRWALWSKATPEVSPLLIHSASLILSMCAHGRRQLPAFDFLAHLLLIPIGFRQSCEGIKLSCNTKISWLVKAINEPKSSELTADIIIRALSNECTLTVSALGVLPSNSFMFNRFDL